jgi:23S rRNA pseudouridine1911/1915/1917 synthase
VDPAGVPDVVEVGAAGGARPEAGERLDAFLARALQLSRRYARRLIARGDVEVDGRRAAPGLRLSPGQRVGVRAFRHPREGPRPDPGVALRLLAEGEGLLAIDKPAGLPSHPLDCDEPGTALGGVLALRPEVGRVGSGLECGLVHRLDRDTSGVLVFALHERAWAEARAAFAERRVHKRYLARVHGSWSGSREVRLRLAGRGTRVRAVGHGGVEAISCIRALRSGGATSLVEVVPRTGARHQIRATLAQLGHPIVGDQLYGSDLRLGRHLLHAECLRIGGFEARAPVPAEFDA